MTHLKALGTVLSHLKGDKNKTLTPQPFMVLYKSHILHTLVTLATFTATVPFD